MAAGRPGAAGAARPGGASFGGHAAPGGSQQFARNGSGIQKRANGKVADVHNARLGMDVHHGLDGSTRTVKALPGGGRVVATRGGGYVQHTFSFHGQDFGHRTYVVNGRVFDRFYGHYLYHGVVFDVYVHAHYYPLGFYAYAYGPWVTPVVYVWPPFPFGAVYGYYYVPYRTYAGPEYWLADSVIAAGLVAAYNLQHPPGAASLTPVPPDSLDAGQQLVDALFPAANAQPVVLIGTPLKGELALEIHRILREEELEARANAAGQVIDPAAGNIVNLFNDGRAHLLEAGASVDVVSITGQECVLTPGDMVRVSGVATDPAVVRVVAAKVGPGECLAGVPVSVAVQDLQDMYNFVRETVDDSLQRLQQVAGTGGLPVTPVAVAGPPANAAFVASAPPPEADASQQIAAQNTQAAAAEQEVTSNVASDPASSAPPAAPPPAGAPPAGAPPAGGPPTTSTAPAPAPAPVPTGASIDQVVAQLGQPVRVIDLGLKKTYVYADARVTFTNGAVSEVQ